MIAVSFFRAFHSFGFGFSCFAHERLCFGIVIDIAFWKFIAQVENIYYGDTVA
jgi:hypothetical protein